MVIFLRQPCYPYKFRVVIQFTQSVFSFCLFVGEALGCAISSICDSRSIVVFGSGLVLTRLGFSDGHLWPAV